MFMSAIENSTITSPKALIRVMFSLNTRRPMIVAIIGSTEAIIGTLDSSTLWDMPFI